MCHFLLVLPIAALPLLWLLPLAVSVPIYLLALGLAAWAYWLAVKAMRTPVMTGAEALLHAVGIVKSVDARRAAVELGGELWFAEVRPGDVTVGDRVEVTGLDGLALKVTRIGPAGAFKPAREPGIAPLAPARPG